MTDAVDIHALAGAYALDAVEDRERVAFERHLAGCAACAGEVAGLREAVAHLSEVVAQPPPAGHRGEVLAMVAGTAQLRPAPQQRGPSMPQRGRQAPDRDGERGGDQTPSGGGRRRSADDTPADGHARNAEHTPGGGRARGGDDAPGGGRRRGGGDTRRRPGGRQRGGVPRWRRLAVAAGILVVTAVLAVAATLAVTGGRVADERHRLAVEQASRRRVDQVLTAPDAVLRTAAAAGGRVAVVTAPGQDAAVAVLTGLAAPPAGRVYRLWTVDAGGRPAAVGQLPAGAGSGSVVIDRLAGVVGVRVSRDPSGGSPAPVDVVGDIRLS